MNIFISYSRKDRELLENVVSQIQTIYSNDRVWYDKAIQGGDDWWNRILREIRQCSIFIYFISQDSIESEYCQKELRDALKQDKAILPVLIRDITPKYPGDIGSDLASELEKIQLIDLTNGLDNSQTMNSLWKTINFLQQNSHKTQRIVLSRVERWILSNQFAILAEVKSDAADTYLTMQEIVENGYEWEYGNITEYIYDDRFTMRRDESLEVIYILDMFRTLGLAYDDLEDKSGIQRHKVQFSGFDGNNETKFMAYTRFLVERQNKFEEVIHNKKYNSHSPMLIRYRRMLEAWENSSDKYNLSKEDLIRITTT